MLSDFGADPWAKSGPGNAASAPSADADWIKRLRDVVIDALPWRIHCDASWYRFCPETDTNVQIAADTPGIAMMTKKRKTMRQLTALITTSLSASDRAHELPESAAAPGRTGRIQAFVVEQASQLRVQQ